MPVNFANESEASVGADARRRGRSVRQPRRAGLPLQQGQGPRDFGNPSTADFSKLLGKVTDAVYSGVAQEDGEFTAAGIDSLLGDVKKVLSPALRKSLVQIAGELGDTDGAGAKESRAAGQGRRALA